MRTAKGLASGIAALLSLAGAAHAEPFAFEIANPVASQDYRVKMAVFVFRTGGCADPAQADVTATAEGIVNGMRRSMLLTLGKSARPGVYAISRQWDAGGQWVVALKGLCGNAQAGAIVPVNASGFIRDATKLYSHPPTAADIESALKALPEGSSR